MDGNIDIKVTDFDGFQNQLKPKSFFYRFWHDPVFSGLIVFVITVTIPFIFSVLKSLICQINLITVIKEVILFKIPLYLILITIILFYVLWLIRSKWAKSYNQKQIDKILKTKLSDFTFSELHNTLLNHHVKNPINLKQDGNERAPLLGYFMVFSRKLNIGVPSDLSGDYGFFMYWTIGSLLISYGLAEKVTVNQSGSVKDLIVTTTLGKRFIQLYQKYKYYSEHVFNDW